MNKNLFEIHRSVAPNGLRLLALPMKGTGTVTLMVFIGTGSRNEGNQEAGISHFLEHLFFKGSKKRPSTLLISEALDQIGGEFNAFTSKEMTAFYAKAAAQHEGLITDVIGDMLLHPLFDPKEIDRERGVVIEEMNMYEDTPLESIGENFENLLYGEHSLGRKIVGTKEIISTVSRRSIVGYMKKQYVAPNVVVCVAGNIDPEMSLKSLGKQFKGFTKVEPVAAQEFANEWNSEPVTVRVKKTDQAHVIVGGRGVSYSDKDRCAVDLLSTILGGSMSSRLFIEVRERRGLAYSVHTTAEHFTDTGYVGTQIGVDPNNVKKAVSVILKEYAKIRDKAVDENELSKAKENIKGHMLLRMESSNAVAQFVGGQEILTGRILNIADIFAGYDGVTANDIQRVARKYLSPKLLRIAAIAPDEQTGDLEKLLKTEA